MNQSDLIAKVAESGEMNKAQAGSAVEAVLDAICGALTSGEKVSLSSLGIFEINDRKARQGRNPATGETIQIAASKSVKFRPAKSLKDAVSPRKKSTAKAAPAKKPSARK